MDIRSLNEAFEKMFEGISEEETFNEEFDEQYASYVTDIDEDSEMMYKMYKTGNVSPADALTSLGYTDGEGDQMISEINSNGVNYVKVFDFNDDGSYTYYVLQDGKVPKGWTTTTAVLDEEFLKEAFESIVSKLDEAETSAKYRDRAQDKIDTMLKRKPVEESVGGKWTEKAFAIVNDLDNTTELKDMLKKLLKDMSDKDVGEFLHQRGYIEYKD